MNTTETGWVATYFDGVDYFDLGAGWGSREEAEAELSDNLHGDMEGVEIYEATTDDGWVSWDPI